ncbi:hypothetical protein [Labedaea rhizosphaerae]|uniref:Uncharacterized protein n=1 Tax=Labedaea rhizosphaerae TaxID=598644 RepID=A0A4R6SMK5_LABRH|nr:hypothetical protein [Labedaea rhizosphaerae]TDQ05756.1 hypothetical protein EV186_1011734 [Labedaea rhizosphaerae]
MSEQLSRVTQPVARSAEPALWRQPAFLIIVIAGCFHLFRGAAVDGVVFLLLAVGLVVTRHRAMPVAAPPTTRANTYAVVGVVLGCALYGWVVGHWTPNTLPVQLAVAVPGLMVMPFAWRVPDVSRTLPDRAWLWAVVGVLVCLWELTSFLFQSDPAVGTYEHPTLSVVLDPLFATASLRSVLVGVWLALGIALFRLIRGRRT